MTTRIFYTRMLKIEYDFCVYNLFVYSYVLVDSHRNKIMKFSYTLLKQLVPSLKSKEELADILTAHVFEVESVVDDAIDIKVLPNRFSDAASHWGMAREIAAVLNVKLSLPRPRVGKWQKVEGALDLILSVEEKKLCPRYMARYFEVSEIGASPAWMQKILKECGMHPINAVVDVMNYAMLETGQPMHVFDADKLKSIVVRRAAAKEKIETLDGGQYELGVEDLVIADGPRVLAIAGIKGGKLAEVTPKTTRIIAESANFDGVSVYKTSKRLKLTTDASVHFAHNLSPVLAATGLERASELLVEICGAKVGEVVDVYKNKFKPAVIKFSADEFARVSGLHLAAAQAFSYLKRLGFIVNGTRVTAPADRTNIERFEDLVDEIVRLHGYDKLSSVSPQVALKPTEHDDAVKFKTLARSLLAGAGYSEAYNYSFVSEKDLDHYGIKAKDAAALENPISSEFAYMRPVLLPHLVKNVSDNFRFYENVRLFEIGDVFRMGDEGVIVEMTNLAVVIGSKKSNPVLELKGVLSVLLERLGLVDFDLEDTHELIKYMRPREILRVESDHHVLGYLGTLSADILRHAAAVEIDLKKLLGLVTGEREYEPIMKFPSVMRDMTLLVKKDVRVGEVLELIQIESPSLVYDVDLLDYYEDSSKMGPDEKSLTFRIVFQAVDRTLTDGEVGKEMERIVSVLKEKLGAEVR